MIKVNGVELKNSRFPNGEIKLNEEQLQDMLHIHGVEIEFYYTGDESIIELIFVTKYFQEKTGACVIVNMMYMPYSRMDREHDETTAFTLRYLCETLRGMNGDGKAEVHFNILEPHSDVCTALMKATKENITEDMFLSLLERGFVDVRTDIVFFPDAGAQKRYSDIRFRHLVGFKHRDWETGEIKSLEVCGEIPPKGFRVWILDDLCSYGGSFYHSAKKLRELGASEVYLIVTHCENTVLEGELINSGLIDKIYTTNTIFTGQHERIEVKEF